MPTFTLIGLHALARRGQVLIELNGLAQVYDELNNIYRQSHPSDLNVLILGDLNADGAYINWNNVNMQHCALCAQRFTWLLRDGIGTNAGAISHFTYDR